MKPHIEISRNDSVLQLSIRNHRGNSFWMGIVTDPVEQTENLIVFTGHRMLVEIQKGDQIYIYAVDTALEHYPSLTITLTHADYATFLDDLGPLHRGKFEFKAAS